MNGTEGLDCGACHPMAREYRTARRLFRQGDNGTAVTPGRIAASGVSRYNRRLTKPRSVSLQWDGPRIPRGPVPASALWHKERGI
jgi:hypothetical protein